MLFALRISDDGAIGELVALTKNAPEGNTGGGHPYRALLHYHALWGSIVLLGEACSKIRAGPDCQA
jgi:hypothetical protein